MRAALGCKTISLPVMPNSFADLFQANKPLTNPSKAALPTHPQADTLNILLVEDNKVNQRVFTQLLAKENYQIDLAENGLEGIKAAHRRPYDVIFMDYMMPEMNGLEAIRTIRKDTAIKSQPYIIALTANAEKKAAEDLIGAGAQIYLAKPVRKADLLGAIEAYRKTRPKPTFRND
ncbi:response regulator [Coraliomargarita algicola]|uniref:Response regulator n=1 Tax=Coraliomargarita algicola TaxID=3092156 RepID=A0ABZ0RS52_9BACT|nr:response regulator [Coraliomargarita sp. J2-16]WPJ98079.1 response regulator [Coraliomargarita sp. J2-16]